MVVFLTVAILGGTAAPRAQDQPPPATQPARSFSAEVTVTATGVATETDEAPTSVTVISREELDDAQAATVAEMLRRVPGLTVVGSGDEGKQTSVFTRGTSSNQTLVMLDGVRLNSPFFGGLDWSQLSASGLQRIESVRGPYSALWGADAVGGVVNLISRRARAGLELRAVGEAGSNGWRRLEAGVGWATGAFDLDVSGFDLAGDGSLDNGDFSNRQLLASAGWSFGGRGSRIGVLVQDLETETGIPFASPGLPTPERRQKGEQVLLALPISLWLSDSWHLELVASHRDGSFDFSDLSEPPFSTSETDTRSMQARFASTHRAGSHELSWGAEWRRDEVTDISNFGTNLEGETTEVRSVFAQDVWRLGTALRLLAGARWDDAEPWGSELSPRADLTWRPSEALELRIGHGKAYRPPSLGELYYPFSGNPGLAPETSSSSDLGLAVSSGRASLWRATIFATELDNLIEFDFASFTNLNRGAATIRGAELSWEEGVGRRGASFLQLTVLDTEDEAGMPLLRRPSWSGSWTLRGAVADRLAGDLSLRYLGARDDIDPTTFERARAGSFLTADLALAWHLGRGMELTGRVLNLADEAYEEVLGYPAAGRRYLAGLRLRLAAAGQATGSP
jgi:vitamin B12 transporter